MRGPDVWKHSGTLRDPESLPVIRKKFSIGRNPSGGEVEWFALMNLKALSHDEIDDDRLLPIGLPEAELVIEIEDDEGLVGVRGTCPRFFTGRHVGQWKSSDMSEQSRSAVPAQEPIVPALRSLAAFAAWRLASLE